MDRFKYIALESSGSGISPNFENDRNAKANRKEDRRKGNARMMEKKKICIRASSCWPRGSGLVGFDLWTGTKDRRTYVHIRTHTRVHIIRVQGIHMYIYTRDTARSSKLFAREEPSRMLLTWWDRGGGESLGWSQHRETRPGSEGKSFETGRRKVHFGVSSWKWDGAEAKRSFGEILVLLRLSCAATGLGERNIAYTQSWYWSSYMQLGKPQTICKRSFPPRVVLLPINVRKREK